MLKALVAVLVAFVPTAAISVVTVAGTILGGGAEANGSTASEFALADIPPEFLAAYQDAATIYGVDWTYIAAIGKTETDHCRSTLPGAVPDTINEAGARGCTQFLGSTWRRGLCQECLEPRHSPPARDGDGYATDGNQDGQADPWTPADAAASTARYLVALGAPDTGWDEVLYGYNNSTAYVREVKSWASQYVGTATPTTGANGNITLASVGGITVNARIAGQLTALLDAATADGLTLTGGGYRDPAAQIALREKHCGPTHFDIWTKPASWCTPPTARPGTSMHEQGLAIDFSNCSTRSTGCYQWLNDNAETYGFYNLPSEPWHWSTTGG